LTCQIGRGLPAGRGAEAFAPAVFAGRGVLWVATCWLALSAFLVGCAPEASEVAPPVDLPARFSRTGEAPQPETWWRPIGEPALDALISEAMANNFTLRAAWDRLDQARAVAARAGAALEPHLTGTAGASRSVTHTETSGTPAAPGRAGATGGSETTYATRLSLGLAASYEVDLWGRIRSTRQAALLDAAASAEQLQAAAITLSADIAVNWLTLIEQRRQFALLGEQLETNEQYLEVITSRFRRGQVAAADVLQQRQIVEATRGEQKRVRASMDVLTHTLAVLLGRPPGTLEPDLPDNLPDLPPLPDAGVPASWIRRRPDIRAAELAVRAADQRVWAAYADQFPRLALTADASTSAERLGDLFDNWLASLAANLTAPLLDGGLRRAELARTRAVASERLHLLGQEVLTGLKEVEDALAREAWQRAYLSSLTAQRQLSADALEQTLDRYTKGTADFTRYLTTLQSHQRLQRTHLQARRELMLRRVELYRALAGGWQLQRPEKARLAWADHPAPPAAPTDPTDRPAGDRRTGDDTGKANKANDADRTQPDPTKAPLEPRDADAPAETDIQQPPSADPPAGPVSQR
jgi:NodT family efflux transporter outer membrane factor (OMF) lipoprotein